MELFRSFLRNTRKPEGFLGKCMVASMNYAHAALADWGLGCLPKTGPVRIAELGCGGGRNIRALLRKYPAATVTALDYSEISVEKARNINQEELQAGRCRVIQGDVSRLPFEDTHITAAGLRMKDSVMETVTSVQENAADILAAAKDINEARAAKDAEAQVDGQEA